MHQSPRHVLHNGRYGLFELLGSGFFGEVWRSRDNLQGDEVAVKLLGRNVTLDAALLEAQLLTRLRAHERIIMIRNVELAPPAPFIVMEYMPAGSVSDRLASGAVTLVDAVRWTREALDGLAHAHDMGVLHRDVKPANLLLDRHDRAVLSDFGIAEDTVRQFLAAPHAYIPHKAPELDMQGSSRQSDIWAMGCTLYRLLTGRYPFATEADASHGKVTDPHRINPQIPLAISRVVRQALAVDRAERYPDARAMLAALMEPDVRHCWLAISDPTAIECWKSTTPDGIFMLRFSERPRSGYEVAVTRDRGSGPRHVVRERLSQRGDALRVRRNCLLQLVSDGTVSLITPPPEPREPSRAQPLR
jgi:serine/threonine protein kinase